MPRSISLFLSRTGGPPYQGSVGYVNDAIAPALESRGWDVRCFQPPPAGNNQEALLPFGLAAQHVRHDSPGKSDVVLYDCAGTTIRTPERNGTGKHMVLYHGLVYGTGSWMANSSIDLHCANSPYLASVLRALFVFPDWRKRRVLNPQACNAVTDIRLPLPCVEMPDGHPGFAHGADAPDELLGLSDSKVVLAHALQPGKQDLFATLSILYWLNVLAREHGSPRVMLLISESSLSAENWTAFDAMLSGTGFACRDFFIPLPHLKQQALVRLMRVCRFGLAYNRFPEPFGFYVLESVHNGCPVYTNGAGNNRFLLPPGHGIIVQETPAMAGTPNQHVKPDAYRSVAESIHADLGRSGEMRASCRKGAALIDRTWSLQAFEQGLIGALERLEQPPADAPVFDQLEVALSPLVRNLDLVSGRSLNDYASGVLDGEACAAVRQLLGQSCADLGSDQMAQIEDRHGLFANGILTLVPTSDSPENPEVWLPPHAGQDAGNHSEENKP
jgi:hypothetical protein